MSVELVNELQVEHRLIERVVGSLRTYAAERAEGRGSPDEAAQFACFFRLFVNAFHHAREEETLFTALHEHAELPDDRGPIAVLRADHARSAALLDALVPLLQHAEAAPRLRERVLAFAENLLHHIDAEDSVLLPESEERLRRHGIRELSSRAMTPEERDAKAIGEALLLRFPPMSDEDIHRGDGCIHCPAYGESCGGLEREWWNASEWDEIGDRAQTG